MSHLEEFGSRAKDFPHSGDLKCIMQGDVLCGVFFLANNGKVFLQTDRMLNYYKEIYESCKQEDIIITGAVGQRDLFSGFWKYYCHREHIDTGALEKNRLLKLDLEPKDLVPVDSIRELTPEDFDAWFELNSLFFEEIGFSQENKKEVSQVSFMHKASLRRWWGMFDQGKLIGSAALNAVAKNMGQVGGVYVLPKYRGQGRSKDLMRFLMHASEEKHNLKSLVLFTANDIACNLYEGLGFKQSGYFGFC